MLLDCFAKAVASTPVESARGEAALVLPSHFVQRSAGMYAKVVSCAGSC